MSRITLLATLSAGLVSLLTGTVSAETRAIDVAPFTSASFDSAIVASVAVGGAQAITIESSNPGALDDVRIEVTGGKLRVWRDTEVWGVLAGRGDDVRVKVSVPSLVALAATAASQIDTSGMSADALEIMVSSAASVSANEIVAKAVRVDATSAGRLFMSGSCETAVVEVTSAANIAADTLECVDIIINATSAGKARLFASGNVTAEVSSAANVELAGHPKHVDDDVHSGAHVNILE